MDLGWGGGLFSRNGIVSVINCTITNNTAEIGRGIVILADNGNATVALHNSILGQAGTPSITDYQDSVQGAGSLSASGSGNLIRNPFSVLNLGIVSNADPSLGPLTHNGGPTFTRQLLAGSPAIDAGDNAALSGLVTDQRRGTTVRVFNGKVDIGAVEEQGDLFARPVAAGGPLTGTTQLFNSNAVQQLIPVLAIPFFPGKAVNVRTAVADVNGDGHADIIGGTGPGSATLVKIFDGKTGGTIATITPFEAAFTGGVFVAAGDIDGDNKDDVVVTPDQGGGPIAALYSGAKLSAGLTNDAAQFRRFFAIEDPAFRGGARPAVGDINGDRRADLVVSAGFLGGPRIAMYDGALLTDTTILPKHIVSDFSPSRQACGMELLWPSAI